METLKLIVFIFLLVDAVAVNFIVWFGEKWYLENLKIIEKKGDSDLLWVSLAQRSTLRKKIKNL